MICTGCNTPIEPGTKYLVIHHNTRNGTIIVEVGCDHYEPPTFALTPNDHVEIFGGSNCFHKFIDRWEASLQVCNHTVN